jgi:hypothetical protein
MLNYRTHTIQNANPRNVSSGNLRLDQETMLIRRRRFQHSPGYENVAGRRGRRSAVITVELLMMLPILLIFLAAITQFGLIFSTIENTEFASRYGARLAAEQTSPGHIAQLVNSGQLRRAINRHLSAAGFRRGVCRLEVELGGLGRLSDVPDTNDCPCRRRELPLPSIGTPVRVTICVPLQGNVPDLLSSFGFSLNNRVVQQTTTMRVER